MNVQCMVPLLLVSRSDASRFKASILPRIYTIVLLVYNEVFSSLPLSILEAPLLFAVLVITVLLVVVGGLLSEGEVLQLSA